MDKVKEEACTHGRTENKHRSFLTSLQLEYFDSQTAVGYLSEPDVCKCCSGYSC